MKYKSNTNRGFIKLIILIVVILLIISYFGINLKGVVDSSTFQSNWGYVKEFIVYIWNHFLSGIFIFIWDTILVPLLKKISG
jgi:hypothetical protein